MSARLNSLLASLNHPSLPGIDLSLDRMREALAMLGNPEARLPPVIHVAGTNGKGSTVAYLRAIFTAAGQRAHVYTSPHLVRFNERIVIGGEEIADSVLIPYLERVALAVKAIPLTFFEATTAAAFLAFAEYPADVVLLEVGLGGRLDATNVIARSLATIITPIAIDHTEFLGSSLSAIAAEKAGIIKPDTPCFCGPQEEETLRVITEKTRAVHAPLAAYGDDWGIVTTPQGMTLHWQGKDYPLPAPSLPGTHQIHNAGLAAMTAFALQLDIENIRHGIAHAAWPARLQRLRRGKLAERWRGDVFLDGGHNEAAAIALAAWIKQQTQPVYLLAGMMKRKDAQAFFKPFAGLVAGIICVPIPHHDDAYAAAELAEKARSAGMKNVVTATSPETAIEALPGDANGVLLVTGSLFLAGEILKDHG